MSAERIDRLSSILSDIGIVLFGSLAVPVFTSQSSVGVGQMLSGILLMVAFWSMSIMVLRSNV